MTHSDPSNKEEVEEVDPFDVDLNNVEDIDDENDLYKVEEKTDSEIQIDQMEQLLSSKRCNTWERGFCDSCLRYLRSKPNAQLSYKQKDVLAKTRAKYSMD